MISQWTVVSVFNKIFNFFVSHLFVIYFLSFQLFVFSALWSSQPFELPSFLVSKLFGPPKMSLVLQPPVAWLLILRTGQWATPEAGRLCWEGLVWFAQFDFKLSPDFSIPRSWHLHGHMQTLYPEMAELGVEPIQLCPVGVWRFWELVSNLTV